MSARDHDCRDSIAAQTQEQRVESVLDPAHRELVPGDDGRTEGHLPGHPGEVREGHEFTPVSVSTQMVTVPRQLLERIAGPRMQG